MKNKVRWGVIGAGGIADRRTIPEGIVPATNAELTVLMDANAALKPTLEEKYNVPFFDSVDALLAADIDAVYIATPTHLHEEQAFAAANAGKHVLCEKPLAQNSATAQRIAEVCAEAGIKLSIGYMMRFNAYHQKLKTMLDAGEFGTPVMGRAQLTCWFPPMAGNWRQHRNEGGGGAMADMATHCFDLLEMFFGRIEEVFAMNGTVVHTYEDPSIEDTAAILVRFPGGAVGFVDAHFNIPDESSEYVFELYGSKGCAKAAFTVCQNSTGEVRACLLKQTGGYDAQQAGNDAGYAPLKVDATPNIYQSEIEAFSKAIQDDAAPPISADDGIWSLKILEAAYQSAKTGKSVKPG